MDNCVFCEIANGEIPRYTVWEDDKYIAFLTNAPHQRGHTLLIPRKHEDYVFDLPESELAELMVKAKPLAELLKKAFMPKTGKIGVIFEGMGVPHVHMHLIPMNHDLGLDHLKQQVSDQDFEQDLKKIKQALSS